MDNVQTPIFKLAEDKETDEKAHSNVVYYTIPQEQKKNTKKEVENLLIGKPNTTLCRVNFLEPITFKHWSIRFPNGNIPSVKWQVKVDSLTFDFQRFGHTLLITGVSGRNFEFVTSSIAYVNVEVHIKIVRGTTVMSSLAAESLLDTKFVVEDKEILANSYLLSAKSAVLRSMLFGTLKESTTKEIKIKDTSYEAVGFFLNFMATDAIEQTDDVVLLLEVYSLAHQYLVPMLQDEITIRITQLVEESNLVAILGAAQEIKAHQIISAVLHKVLEADFKGCAEGMSHLY